MHLYGQDYKNKLDLSSRSDGGDDEQDNDQAVPPDLVPLFDFVTNFDKDLLDSASKKRGF